MTDYRDERRAELIAAALASDLTLEEAAEFDRMRVQDPSIDVELEQLGTLTSQLLAVEPWIDVDNQDPALERTARSVMTAQPQRSRWPLALTAAAGIAVGVGIGLVVPAVTAPAPVVGPPGTLGAIEHVLFTGEPAGVEIDGDLIAHTWGTETILTVDGLPAGESYAVVVIGDGGREYQSGTFLGSEVTINCAVNAAAMRDVVTAVEVRDETGLPVAVASVPPVQR